MKNFFSLCGVAIAAMLFLNYAMLIFQNEIRTFEVVDGVRNIKAQIV